MKIWMLKSDFKAFEGLKRVNIVILRLKFSIDIKKWLKTKYRQLYRARFTM